MGEDFAFQARKAGAKRCGTSCAQAWRSMGRKRPLRWWLFRAGWV